MSHANDKLHQQALDALKDRKATKAEQAHLDEAFNYNQRRTEATKRFGEIASQIWEKLEAGETVGGVGTKEGWCSVVGIKIRWAQESIRRYRVSQGRTDCAPDADPNFHPLCAGIGSSQTGMTVDWDENEAWVVVGMDEWTEQPKSNWHSVSGEFAIKVRAQDVPMRGKDKKRVCPLCHWQRMVDDAGCFEKHVGETWWEKNEEGKEVVKGKDCPSSGKPTVEYVTEPLLIHALYKKMKITLQGMRLWNEAIKKDFEREVAEMKKSHANDVARRSDAAKRGAETRKKKTPHQKTAFAAIDEFSRKCAGA